MTVATDGDSSGATESNDDSLTDDDDYVTSRGPPVPDIAYRLINPLVSMVLRSPVHSLLSDSVLLLTFTGTQSGERYTTPVGYWVRDGRVIVTTHSPWWRNLRGGQPVTLLLRGQQREGVATPYDDPTTVAEFVQTFIDRNGVEAVRRLGIVVDGQRKPTRAELEAGVGDTVVIEIEFTDDGPAP